MLCVIIVDIVRQATSYFRPLASSNAVANLQGSPQFIFAVNDDVNDNLLDGDDFD